MLSKKAQIVIPIPIYYGNGNGFNISKIQESILYGMFWFAISLSILTIPIIYYIYNIPITKEYDFKCILVIINWILISLAIGILRFIYEYNKGCED